MVRMKQTARKSTGTAPPTSAQRAQLIAMAARRSRPLEPTPPNYFVCIRIKNEKIKDKVIECQNSIKKIAPELEKTFVKPETLHLTLFAVSLEDEEQVDEISEELNKDLDTEFANIGADLPSKLELTFTGLAHSKDSVVYVNLVKDESYEQLTTFQEDLTMLFESWGADVSENSFTPHMTLMKAPKSSPLQGIEKIDKDTYSEWAGCNFGSEKIDSIYLCSIKERQEDGFYYTHKSVELKL